MKLFLISSMYVIALFLIPLFIKLLILKMHKLNIKMPIYRIYQNFLNAFFFLIIIIFVINRNPVFVNHRLIFIICLFAFFLLSFSKIFEIVFNNYIFIKHRFNIDLNYILFVIILINFILIFFNYIKNGLFTYILLLFFYLNVSRIFFKDKNS